MHRIVTGCARSGTTYMSKVLQACGLRCPHEEWGPDGTVAWQYAADASSCKVEGFKGRPPRGMRPDDRVLHIIR
jgi:hypothetical protein